MKLVRVHKMSELKHYDLGDYLCAIKVVGGIMIFYTQEEITAWRSGVECDFEIVDSTKSWPWLRD